MRYISLYSHILFQILYSFVISDTINVPKNKRHAYVFVYVRFLVVVLKDVLVWFYILIPLKRGLIANQCLQPTHTMS